MMSAEEKFKAAMWMLHTCREEQLSHKFKNTLIRVAYSLLFEAMTSLHPSITVGMDNIPY